MNDGEIKYRGSEKAKRLTDPKQSESPVLSTVKRSTTAVSEKVIAKYVKTFSLFKKSG